MLTFTAITSPEPVTKQFKLNGDGKLVSETAAEVYSGRMRRVQVPDVQAFANALSGLTTNQCLTYGVPPRDAALITEKQWVKRGRPEDALPRSKEVFAWPTGPGVMLLDYDAPKDGTPALSKDALLQMVEEACPVMLLSDLIWWPSTSSQIYTDAGKQLRGIRGQRLYPMVQDATDIPRAGKALNERLWALGHGRYEVSKSGSLLERGVFDASVWQTNRIDFAAGAACGKGLEQRRGEPVVLEGILGGQLDTRSHIPDPTADEVAAAKQAKARARAILAKEAEIARAAWLETSVAQLLRRNPRLERDEAEKQAKRAAEQRELMGDWVLQLRDVNDELLEATVLEVLDNPATYHGVQTRDPLEPDYDGGRWVGKLYLYGARPVLHSMAHGGVTFRLSRQPLRIEAVKGKGSETTDALLNTLRRATDVFDFGAELVVVGLAGCVYPMNEHALRYESGKLTQFWYWRTLRDGTTVEELCDPPANICKSVLSMGERRGLKPLDAVITAPTLRHDGSVLDTPGYDPETRLLYDCEGEPFTVPAQPTEQQAREALEFLWTPFESFPFVGPLDRAAHLAAILTAAVRPILPTSPAFAYDAPVQGSGKTLLARCVGILTEGKDPSVWPHTAGRDDEETRKRLFAVLRSGARSMVWDNITGTFDSAAMASALTSPTFTDRILGVSTSSSVPNRMVMLLTGNNLTLAGDMPRRVLVARIDPETDRPFARSFELDPAAYCQAKRQQMISAALTLIRAMLTHGCLQPSKGKMASFEQWDGWVRQAVIYANELWPGQFGDLMELVEAAQASDPEQDSLNLLMTAWESVFGNGAVQVSEVLKRATEMFDSPLREALDSFVLHGKLTAKSIGRLLTYRAGRIVNGRRLECTGKDSDGTKYWAVRSVGAKK
jgi:hypothetical protein